MSPCLYFLPLFVSDLFYSGITAPIQDVNIMDPPLLVRAWMMAHLYGAKVQAVVCYAGSSGEVAFRESLRAQYTLDSSRWRRSQHRWCRLHQESLPRPFIGLISPCTPCLYARGMIPMRGATLKEARL